MNENEALGFLKRHQPMLSDKELTREIINKYDEVRKLFLTSRNVECIPLFLNSFGGRDGFGVYQLIEDVIRKYEAEEVIPILKKSLKSKHPSIRYWNAQIALYFPSYDLLSELKSLLKENDTDIKEAALSALSQYKYDDVYDAILDFYNNESSEELRDFSLIIMDDLKRDIGKEK